MLILQTVNIRLIFNKLQKKIKIKKKESRNFSSHNAQINTDDKIDTSVLTKKIKKLINNPLKNKSK